MLDPDVNSAYEFLSSSLQSLFQFGVFKSIFIV